MLKDCIAVCETSNSNECMEISNKMMALKLDGKNITKIAEIFKTSRRNVYYYLSLQDLSPKLQRLTSFDVPQNKRLPLWLADIVARARKDYQEVIYEGVLDSRSKKKGENREVALRLLSEVPKKSEEKDPVDMKVFLGLLKKTNATINDINRMVDSDDFYTPFEGLGIDDKVALFGEIDRAPIKMESLQKLFFDSIKKRLL